jgi:heme/copper-type cytochrome/quinol oxidase subunit 2
MAFGPLTRRAFVATAALSLANWAFPFALGTRDTPQSSGVKEFTIRARRYAFNPARIEVARGDIVKITLIAEDIAHSFTIDEYRISKRATPGRSITFEFSADRAGRFVFYCNLTTDEGCRAMRGELIVR